MENTTTDTLEKNYEGIFSDDDNPNEPTDNNSDDDSSLSDSND